MPYQEITLYEMEYALASIGYDREYLDTLSDDAIVELFNEEFEVD